MSRLGAPATEVGDPFATLLGQMANSGGGSADVVRGDEADPGPDQLRVDRDAGKPGGDERGELRLLGHEGAEDDALGPVAPAEIEVARRLAADLAGRSGEKEDVDVTGVRSRADSEEDVVEEGMPTAVPTLQPQHPTAEVHRDCDQASPVVSSAVIFRQRAGPGDRRCTRYVGFVEKLEDRPRRQSLTKLVMHRRGGRPNRRLVEPHRLSCASGPERHPRRSLISRLCVERPSS